MFKPVIRIGKRSGNADKHARYLDRINAPYLHRVNGDGSVSVKREGRLYARNHPETDPLPDGFYVLGHISGALRIMGSANARGRFTDRGGSGSSGFALTTLAFFGGGKACDIELSESGPGTPNIDGKYYPVMRVELFTTRTGRDSKLRHTFFTANVAGEAPPRLYDQSLIPFYEWAGTVFNGVSHQRVVYVVGIQIVGAQHTPRLYSVQAESGGSVQSLPIPNTPGQLCVAPSLAVVNTRGKLILINRYVRPTYAHSAVDVSGCKGISLETSSDNGATWTTSADLGILSDASTLSTLPVEPNSTYSKYYAFLHNTAAVATRLSLFCTNTEASSGVVLALVPKVEFIVDAWIVKYRLLIGTYNGFSSTQSIVLKESRSSAEASFAASSPVPCTRNGEHGVLFVDRSAATKEEIPLSHGALKWTNGVTVTTLGAMPFTNNKTGAVSAIGRNTFVCPMYDGAFCLYQLNDDMTWSKRATIYDGPGVGLPTSSEWALKEFSVLTYIRKDGEPVSAKPSAPWMTDSRKAAPT